MRDKCEGASAQHFIYCPVLPICYLVVSTKEDIFVNHLIYRNLIYV
jgi:hypothetical protein